MKRATNRMRVAPTRTSTIWSSRRTMNLPMAALGCGGALSWLSG
jgi:hypothetical protein